MTTKESGLGELDNIAATKAAESAKKNVWESYVKYTAEERCNIGKYASKMGTAAAVRKFRKERSDLNESTVRTFTKKYKDELKLAPQEKRAPKRKTDILKRGHPLLLGKVDEMVQSCLSTTRHLGGFVSRSIAIETAKAWIKRNPQFNLLYLETVGQKVYFSEWVMLDEQKLLLKYRFPKPFKKKQSLSSNIKLQKLLKHTKFQIA